MKKKANSTEQTPSKQVNQQSKDQSIRRFLSVTEASLALSHGTYSGTSPVANKRKVEE